MRALAADQPETVWTRPDRGARGPAPERSRAQVTAAAVELADEGGLAAVSMRQVAKMLDTGPASLYRYVGSRDDLVDLMVDAMAGEIDLGVPLSGDPVDDLVALADRTKAVHLRHPWLLDVPPEHLRAGPRGLDHLEYGLRAMAPASLPGPAKLAALALLNSLVTQFARLELHGRRSPTDRQAAQAAYLAGAASDGNHPLLAAAMAEESTNGTTAGTTAVGGPANPQASFERMVRWVLTGLVG